MVWACGNTIPRQATQSEHGNHRKHDVHVKGEDHERTG